ncbi:MoaF-related domain-containing protein [Paraburkholderia sp. SIMBA_054]|uniref:MoaF-related domain-containing protein n=1 Tax=Paraburkholderia sp. SIMBA_054 TaxID=3085795 RepID=UPI00397E5C16
MTMKGFPVGQEMEVSYPPFKVYLTIQSATELTFAIREGKFARTETVEIQVVPIGNSVFVVSWKESNGATVVNVQDYDRGVFQSFVTLASGEFWRMTGSMVVTRPANKVSDDRKRSMNDTLPSRG